MTDYRIFGCSSFGRPSALSRQRRGLQREWILTAKSRQGTTGLTGLTSGNILAKC
jgi:hypothetical protein